MAALGNGYVSSGENLTIESGTGNILIEAVTGDISLEAPTGELNIDVLGDIDVSCSNMNLPAASFGQIANQLNGTITFMNSTSFNISANTTTDFASGSTVDFTGATVTGLPSGGMQMNSGTFTTGSSPETVNVSGVGFEPTMIQLISIPENKLYSDKFQCNGYWKDGDYSMAYSLYGNSPIVYYERTSSYIVYCGTGGGGVDLTAWISSTNSDGFDVQFGGLPVSITFIWYAWG